MYTRRISKAINKESFEKVQLLLRCDLSFVVKIVELLQRGLDYKFARGGFEFVKLHTEICMLID